MTFYKSHLLISIIVCLLCGVSAVKGQNNAPEAAYDYQVISLCDTIVIQFFDLSDSTSTNWLWNFPEGNPKSSRDQNPVITFENYGSYTVSMVVTNPIGTDVLYEANAISIDENSLPIQLPEEIFKCANKSFTLSLAENPNFEYGWTANEDLMNPTILNATFNNTEASQYALSITDIQYGCTLVAKTFVKIHPSINLIMGDSLEICRGDSVQLSASTGTLLTGISWVEADSLQNSDSLNPIANPSSTSTYTVNVADFNGCEASGSQTVVVSTNNLAVSAGNDVSICKGTSVNLSATAGSVFSWSPGTSLNDSTLQNVQANPLETTTYVLAASTQYCAGIDSITVFVLDAPLLEYEENYSICTGDTVKINQILVPTESYTYVWSPDTNISNLNDSEPFVYPLQNENYTLIASNNAGCSNTTQITINVLEEAMLETSIDTTICMGDTIQLFANGGTNYSWLPVASLSDPFIQQPNVFPTQSTTYTVVSSVGTCEATGEVTVFVQAPIEINLGDDQSICLGDSIELSAESGLSFNWSPTLSLNNSSSQTVIAKPDSTTTYVLQVSDQFCSNTDSVRVQVLDKPASAYLESYAFCVGDSITLSNELSNPSYSYSWSPFSEISTINASEPIVYPTQSTSYTVVITDGNLCMDTVQIKVEAVEQIVLQVSMDTTICAGDTIQLEAFGGLNYNWSPSVNLSNSNDSITLAYPIETTTYTVSSAAGSCSASANILIGVYPSPSVNAGDDIYVCKGDEVQIQAEGAGGLGYNWLPETGLSNPGIVNPFFGDTISTEYVVRTENNFGCVASDSILVEVRALPELSVSPNVPTICRDGSIPLTASGAETYQWLPVATLNVDTGVTVVASPTQPTTYTLGGTDEWGCRSSYFITVDIIDSLNLTLIADTIRGCIDAPILLAAFGAQTYFWSPSDYLNTTAGDSVYCNFNQVDTLYYSVTGTDFTDCTAERNVVVIVSDRNAELIISNDAEVCLGDSILLEATGLESYSWLPTDQVSSPNMPATFVQANADQTYQMSGFDFGGCRFVAEVDITVLDLPKTSLNYALMEVCSGKSIDITAAGGSSYFWSPVIGIDEAERSQATITSFTEENITYFVNIIDDNNCQITDSVRVIVNDCVVDYKSLIPTAFSPNQDNYNELWELRDPAFRVFHEELSIAVFNRWGQLLFEDKGSKWQWDGVYNDQPLPEATYYYQLILNEEIPPIHGTVTLLR